MINYLLISQNVYYRSLTRKKSKSERYNIWNKKDQKKKSSKPNKNEYEGVIDPKGAVKSLPKASYNEYAEKFIYIKKGDEANH